MLLALGYRKGKKRELIVSHFFFLRQGPELRERTGDNVRGGFEQRRCGIVAVVSGTKNQVGRRKGEGLVR